MIRSQKQCIIQINLFTNIDLSFLLFQHMCSISRNFTVSYFSLFQTLEMCTQRTLSFQFNTQKRFHQKYYFRYTYLQQLRKVPTSILLKPDNSFHSFGKTAEDTYAQKFDNDMRDWKLFKNFKMCLYNAKDKVCVT